MALPRSSADCSHGESSQLHADQSDHGEPEQFRPEFFDDAHDISRPNRLIIAVDFGTTYSSVSYVAVPKGCPPESVDPELIRSIRNYPNNWNYNANDPMHAEVPTEVIYPLNRRFRNVSHQKSTSNGIGHETPEDSQDMFLDLNLDVDMAEDEETSDELGDFYSFRWGYQVHELWSLPATHSDDSMQPLSRFKLMLDNSPYTRPLRTQLGPVLQELQAKKVIRDHLDVIVDFLTHLLEHTQSELHRQGFDDTYQREIVLCVPAIWTQKACREMQACMATAMQRANFAGVDLQNNSIQDLFIVSEPEAAAEYVLNEKHDIECGDVFVLLDAGGGTVDVNTYEISSQAPFKLSREVVPPDGSLHGSSFLNEAFYKHLREILRDEKYLEDGTQTIDGIVQHLVMDNFEYRIKRTFDCFQKKPSDKLFPVSGLRDNPEKGFKRGNIVIDSNTIKGMFAPLLHGIVVTLRRQLDAARQRGSQVKKVVLIGGFAASKSLTRWLDHAIKKYNEENRCRITLIVPEDRLAVNAVASGAVLRALNKEQGPQREARSSYGILRTEPFGDHKEHKGLKPYTDKHDGLTYIGNTILWVLPLGKPVPAIWQSKPISCAHSFNIGPGSLVCREILYVSDRSTESHWRLSHLKNEGAEKLGEIEVDFSFLRDRGLIQPIEPTIVKNGKKLGQRHYRVNYDMIIRVVDRDLKCYAIYDGRIHKRCSINIAAGFRPGVK